MATAGPGARGAAFFDLDKTLMEGSSALQFGRAAYKAGVIGRRQLARDLWANVRFRLEGATDETIAALVERVKDGVAGTRAVDLARLGPDVLAGILPRIYPAMLRVAYDHQDAGRPAYIVSAASHDLVELLARVLALDHGIGTRYELADGRFTGRLDGPFTYRDGKPEALRQVAERDGIDLDASYAYSDSESDLPMLRAVGHPVAVNPDAELERVARAEGWPIMRFDRLRRRVRIAAAVGALALVGGGGGYAAAALRARASASGRRWPSALSF